MNFFANEDTIIANSSCDLKNGAIAVVRVSGFKKLEDLQKNFSFNLEKAGPRKIIHTDIVSSKKKILDRILFCYFKAPKSYTGENLVELYVHGNKINIKRIIEAFVSDSGCRPASAGEFTYRALRNKKMSFSEVEGLEMVLNAETPMMLDSGQQVLLGDLSLEYQKLHDLFLKMKTAVELMIDFSEDVDEKRAQGLFNEATNKFKTLIKSLYLRCQTPLSTILSPSIVLLGQTNAGKSTLFNYLLGEERSIISPKEGTTRDFISEYLNIEGNSFKLVDSAGLRKGKEQDEIEDEGIVRAINLAKSSFFKVLVINPTQKPTPYLKGILKELSEVDLIIKTHQDIKLSPEVGKEWCFLDEEYSKLAVTYFSKVNTEIGPIGPTDEEPENGPIGPFSEAKFRRDFYSAIDKKYQEIVGEKPIIIERHRQVIGDIYNKISGLGSFEDVGILAHEVFELGNLVSNLIGIITPDRLLTSIFNNFCIGK